MVKYTWDSFKVYGLIKQKSFNVIPAAVRMKENKRTWQFTVRKTAHDITEIKDPRTL